MAFCIQSDDACTPNVTVGRLELCRSSTGTKTQFSIGPPVILRVSTKNYLITTSFHTLSNSLFTNNHIIIRCAFLSHSNPIN